MNARLGSGWQYVMTDLSLILFMITAAALSAAPDTRAPVPPPARAALPALSEPVAVWRPAPGGPGLAQWLASQPADPRLRLTITAPFARADAALQLAREAGRPARVLIEPEAAGPPFAALTYDQAPALARSLQNQRQAGAVPARLEPLR